MTDRYYELFENIGEKRVREHLAHGSFQSRKAAAARLWLEELERARSDSSQEEQLSIASDARDAAWAAARAANKANTLAKIALIIATIAMIVGAIGIYLQIIGAWA